MPLISVCESCAENGRIKAGVYRDDRGQVLCDDCDSAVRERIVKQSDYERPMDTCEPKRHYRNRW